MIAFAFELLAVKSLFEHWPACGPPPHEYGGFRGGWMGIWSILGQREVKQVKMIEL